MATGWAGDGAVQDQIDATVEDAIKRARSQLHQGPSLTHCEECDAPIPEARRKAVPGVHLCVNCQQAHDRGAGGARRLQPSGQQGQPAALIATRLQNNRQTTALVARRLRRLL